MKVICYKKLDGLCSRNCPHGVLHDKAADCDFVTSVCPACRESPLVEYVSEVLK